jgi:DNA repair ATPase RecN
MSSSWAWPGSHWWRVDLHAHSQASYDFRPDADRLAKDWAAWISAASQGHLDAVALTDHNCPDGLPEIQALAAASELVVFPGVEVTVGGIHLLCLFDPACSRDDIVSLLSKLGIEPSMYHQQGTSSTKSIGEAIELAAANAIVIAAHVNGPKGLLTMPPGQDRLKAIKAHGLIAAELAPLPTDPAAWLDPTGAETQDWLNGTNTEGAKLAQVWGSDSHALAEAARRYTWVKMTRPNAEGLRLALLDGTGSLKLADATDSNNPNTHAEYLIESISVQQAKYMGRGDLDDPNSTFTIDFNPWLNALIGGRGTGKSTLVDLLRKAFNRDDELNNNGETSLRATFDKRMRIPPSRQEEGLLTESTSVQIIYRKDGERYAISWSQAGLAIPIARIDGDQQVREEGEARTRFPIRIYSQKQLFELAKEPNALLTFIDDSSEVRGEELLRLRNEAETKYLAISAEVRAIRTQVSELPSLTVTLQDVRRKLELLQQGDNKQVFAEYRARHQLNTEWESFLQTATESIESTSSSIEDTASEAIAEFAWETDEDPAQEALKRAQKKVLAGIAGFRAEVLAAVEKARAGLDQVQGSIDLNAWNAAVSACDLAYQQVMEELAAAGIANPAEYADLLQRASELAQQIAALERQRTVAEERQREATATLQQYREARAELTKRRKLFVARSSNDLIRVEIQGFALSEGLEGRLREALGVPRFDEDYQQLVGQLIPASSETWSFTKLDALVSVLHEVLDDASRQLSTKDRRFETALRKLQPERLDRVALLLPEDVVEVSFHDPRDERTIWRSLAQGSPGQQTAALLAFVLGYGQEPIILDQPEDDLDTKLICDLLVRRLRETKSTRQVIVVTHNPNIVVHADAELVVSLESRGGQTRVAFSGGLQEQKARDEICSVMEGGREAFETRYNRIMLPGGRSNG